LDATRSLKCSFVVGLAGDPNQARCDGYGGSFLGAGVLVGGDRAAVTAEERRCEKFAEFGMTIGGLVVDARGRGAISCAGDAEQGGPYLAVGQSISSGPFTCTGRPDGLRCVAKSGHGFFFGRTTWSTF
jgi:predicted lipoprotein with Yx(FWY)xxD motif